MSAPVVSIICEKPSWRKRIPALVETTRAAAVATYLATRWSKREIDGRISICFSDDRNVQILNRKFRNKNAPTNVLSFAAWDNGGIQGNFLVPGQEICAIGDIILAYETVRDEALAQRKPFAYHGIHLVVHGVLHLLGYDHQTAGDANKMERLERQILRRFNIPDPYRIDNRLLESRQ